MTDRRWQTRIRELVRQFKENGMKMLLEDPPNVRDLLRVVRAPWLDDIDFRHMEQIKTTFIRRDYRHLESDIVLAAPLAGPRKSLGRKVLIYILIEHQSEPDRLMPLRLADSQLQLFRYQVRQWSPTHGSPARVRLMPVLPVVFYTGLRRWPAVGTIADLIERGGEFRTVTPIVERPLFLNLPEVDAAILERDGGFFRLGVAARPTAEIAERRVSGIAGARRDTSAGDAGRGTPAVARSVVLRWGPGLS